LREFSNNLKIEQMLKFIRNLFKGRKQQCNLSVVSGDAWDLPDGVYQVGVDKAAKGSKDYSTRIWIKKGISGEMVIVAEEHHR
jgi:hypothetical protein